MLNVELLNSYILVIQERGEEKIGSIIVPEQAITKKNRYEVITVASDVTAVAVGDIVIIDRFAGNEQVIDDVKYFVTKPEDILLRFKSNG